VDGPQVVDHDALFNPPMELRLPLHTEESWARLGEEIAQKNKDLVERIERGKGEGREVNSCCRIISDHDLSPRENSNQ